MSYTVQTVSTVTVIQVVRQSVELTATGDHAPAAPPVELCATPTSVSTTSSSLYTTATATAQYTTPVHYQFCVFLADVKIEHIHSLLCCSETECNIVLCMRALIATLMPLHRVKSS